MYILLTLIMLLSLISVLLLIFPVKVKFNFISQPFFTIKALASWIAPFIKIEFINKDVDFLLYIYLFNKIIFTKEVKIKKTSNNNMKILKDFKPTFIDLKTNYGFYDPSFTGVMYSIINSISNYIHMDNLSNNPDFNCADTYINVEMFLKFNSFFLLIALLKVYAKNLKNKPKVQTAK